MSVTLSGKGTRHLGRLLSDGAHIDGIVTRSHDDKPWRALQGLDVGSDWQFAIRVEKRGEAAYRRLAHLLQTFDGNQHDTPTQDLADVCKELDRCREALARLRAESERFDGLKHFRTIIDEALKNEH